MVTPDESPADSSPSSNPSPERSDASKRTSAASAGAQDPKVKPAASNQQESTTADSPTNEPARSTHDLTQAPEGKAIAPIELKAGTSLLLLSMLVIPLILLFKGSNPFQIQPIEALRLGANFTPLVLEGEYGRTLTSLFMHFGLAHLALNLLGLALLGSQLEKRIHGISLLLVFLITGWCGSALHVGWEWYAQLNPSIAAGASGGVMGLLGMLVVLCWRKPLRSDLLNLKALLWLSAINLGYGLVYPGIDNSAHLGGFIGGVTLGGLYVLINKFRR